MRRILLYAGAIVVLGIAGLILWAAFRVRVASTHFDGANRNEWSPAAAASYLDYREAWWQNWQAAQMERGTVCISCHTVVPYAFVRPALRRQLGETAQRPAEIKMLNSIEARVNEWATVKPYYTDASHAEPSRSTEAVLNAVILATYSTEKTQLDPVARRAFDNAWALQETAGENAGAWKWQDFHEAPWESAESGYQGAAMMATAVGMVSGKYSNDLAMRDRVERLRNYLLRSYVAQPALNQLYVLWASAEMPGLLSDLQREELIQKVAGLQNADGGWSLSSLDKQEASKPGLLGLFKHSNQTDGSDGCATGLAVLVMEKTGINSRDPVLQRGLAWLRSHQSQKGSWWAASMNGFRDPASDTGHFMSDAATGYAVMALEGAESEASGPAPAHSRNTLGMGTSTAFEEAARIPKSVLQRPM